MKLGEPIVLQLTKRYYQFNRQFAIRDVFDALVELITNSDDSYHRLFKKQLRAEDGGPILIDICKQKKGAPSFIIVRDKAEGMTLDTMIEKLGNVGTRRSEEGDRGFMARGAKDCTELGKIVFESIKDGKYYKAELTRNAQFIPWVKKRSVNNELRNSLGISRGNGTVVTLEISREHRVPRVETIIRDLPWLYALRDILSKLSPTKASVRNLNDPKSKPLKIIYTQPDGELVCDETFKVIGYESATAKLKIFRHPEQFEDSTDRFRKSGLIIKGKRAIHECSLLHPGFERDPYAKHFFGRLECPYIDVLLDEYDKRRENDEEHPSENPCLLIDPNRQAGLLKEHPFTQALFKIPSERLKALIDKEKERYKSQQKEIASEETRNRLNSLAKAASKFLTQQIEDIEELTKGDEVDEKSFSKKGVLIFPTYLRIGIGETRALTFYVNRALFDKEGQEVSACCDSPAISVLDPTFKLRAHPKKSDRLLGTFRIKGETIEDSVCIQVSCPGIPEAEAIAQVVESRVEDHKFTESLEFEYKTYQVREGSSRTLKLFAKSPELVNQGIKIKAISSDSESLPVRGQCKLVPVAGTNYALGEVCVQGRRLKQKSIVVAASLNGNQAVTKIKVIQQRQTGVKIEFKLVDEDFGIYRAMWNEREGKPNELLISAQHASISRYLKYNRETNEFEGDKTPHFRILLAEIVTENVCRKSLLMETRARSWEFRWADLKEDETIADAVTAQLQRRIRNFAPIAHKIMLSPSEIKAGL